MNRMNTIRFTWNRQNVCFLGGIILAGNRARPPVPGNQASKNWNGLSKMSELFTVDASSLALTSMYSSLPSVVLLTEDPLSSCSQKSYICVAKIKRTVSSTNPCMRVSFRRRPALRKEVSSTNNSSSSSFKRFLENDAKRKSK